MTVRIYPESQTALPDGAWRFDPFRRVQVFVLAHPERVEPDVRAEIEPAKTEKPKWRPKRMVPCPECGQPKRVTSIMCATCRFAKRRAERTSDGPRRTLRLREPVDEVRVQMVLDGKALRCGRPERHEVLRRWMALGRSLNALAAQTGWNVYRDKRELGQHGDQVEEVAA